MTKIKLRMLIELMEGPLGIQGKQYEIGHIEKNIKTPDEIISFIIYIFMIEKPFNQTDIQQYLHYTQEVEEIMV